MDPQNKSCLLTKTQSLGAPLILRHPIDVQVALIMESGEPYEVAHHVALASFKQSDAWIPKRSVTRLSFTKIPWPKTWTFQRKICAFPWQHRREQRIIMFDRSHRIFENRRILKLVSDFQKPTILMAFLKDQWPRACRSNGPMGPQVLIHHPGRLWSMAMACFPGDGINGHPFRGILHDGF